MSAKIEAQEQLTQLARGLSFASGFSVLPWTEKPDANDLEVLLDLRMRSFWVKSVHSGGLLSGLAVRIRRFCPPPEVESGTDDPVQCSTWNEQPG
jgi:hypothetical protein